MKLARTLVGILALHVVCSGPLAVSGDDPLRSRLDRLIADDHRYSLSDVTRRFSYVELEVTLENGAPVSHHFWNSVAVFDRFADCENWAYVRTEIADENAVPAPDAPISELKFDCR